MIIDVKDNTDLFLKLGFYEIEEDKEWVALPTRYEEIYIRHVGKLLRPKVNINVYTVVCFINYRRGSKTRRLVYRKPFYDTLYRVEQYIKKKYLK